jgi:hypothetical protein
VLAKNTKSGKPKTTIDINSPNNEGSTPLHSALRRGCYTVSQVMVIEGANLFAKDNDGLRGIDIRTKNDDTIFLGRRLLEYGKNIKWRAVKELLLLAASSSSSLSDNNGIYIIDSDDPKKAAAQLQSSRIKSSVLSNPDLVRHISEFLRRTDIITVDPSIQVPDAVRERVEAILGQV